MGSETSPTDNTPTGSAEKVAKRLRELLNSSIGPLIHDSLSDGADAIDALQAKVAGLEDKASYQEQIKNVLTKAFERLKHSYEQEIAGFGGEVPSIIFGDYEAEILAIHVKRNTPKFMAKDEIEAAQDVTKSGTPDPRYSFEHFRVKMLRDSGGELALLWPDKAIKTSLAGMSPYQVPDTSGGAIDPSDIDERIVAIVSEIREQNWKNGGALMVDNDEAANKIVEYANDLTDDLQATIVIHRERETTLDRMVKNQAATIAMQREAISAAEIDLDGIASDIQKGLAVPGNGTLNFAMQIQARLSKALSTPPSDFIERIKREEREACENILKRRIVGWCIGASQSFHAPRKAAQCKAIIDELEKVLDFIRARSQELG